MRESGGAPGTDDDRGSVLVSVSSARKTYGDHVVLDDVDVTLRSAEKVVLIGASGSGKTTLLRCLVGLEPLDTGRIEIDGHALNYEPKTKPSRQDVRRATAIVGMVFQQFNLFPHMTVLDNLITAPIHALGDAHGPAPLLLNRFQQLVRGSGDSSSGDA